MGITAVTLKMLSEVMPKRRILSLGYPDLVVTAEQVKEILGVTPTVFTKHGEWHDAEHALPETLHVMELIGATMDCVDIVASRGCERIVDLNYPQELGEYDLVLDCGTTEHCFNVAQALMNAAHAVRPKGGIYHSFPANSMNHGFWNASPTLFHDFYSQNGWHVEVVLLSPAGSIEIPPMYKRFTTKPETYVIAFAQRPSVAKPMQFPMQEKYRRHPTLSKQQKAA